MKFIFIEDRDVETGHGWRDIPHKLSTEGKDGRVLVTLSICEEDGGGFEDRPELSIFPENSYAWICSKKYYEKHRCLQDNIRTEDIKWWHENFKGIDNMESHFEFNMTPEEMRKHLIGVGMEEVKRKF